MTLFEVTGPTLDSLDVNLVLSSRVNDYQLVGVVFAGPANTSVLAVPYDYKQIVIWNNVL